MVSDLFLIIHKVRGEPAFDIAHRLQIGEEEGWIIPTSGHRAYPLGHWLLEDLFDGSDYPHQRPAWMQPSVEALEAATDHYQTLAAKGKGQGTQGRDLLERIGLVAAREPMTRRQW